MGDSQVASDMGEIMGTHARKIILLACFASLSLSLLVADLFGQEDGFDFSQIDLDAVDFRLARMSIAGPRSFLIRSVDFDGASYSVLFEEDGGNWVITELIPEDSLPVLPDNVILDFATISITDEGLLIDGIMIDGENYSTTLRIEENHIDGNARLESAKLVGTSLSRISQDAGLYTEDDISSQSIRINELTQRNTELASQVGQLAQNVEDLNAENLQLQDQMAQLREEKTVLDREVSSLEQQLAQYREILEEKEKEAANAPSDAELPLPNTEVSEPEGELPGTVELANQQELQEKIDQLLNNISGLESHIDNLEQQLSQFSVTQPEPVASGEAPASSGDDEDLLNQLEELKSEIAQLRIENARLSAQRSQIEQEVRQQILSEGFIASMSPELTEVRHRGFSTAEPQIGNWELNNGVMAQTDPGQYYAKLELPLPQDDRPTLYSFQARSQGRGWTGFGVHVFADGTDLRGYGYGESLLIWFTRDPREYGDDRTYVELYRSSDNINMARVLSAALPEDSREWMDIQVLYQPNEEYITIAVNGEEKLRYRTWFGIDWGVKVALRALNTAEFRDLAVQTSPGELRWP